MIVYGMFLILSLIVWAVCTQVYRVEIINGHEEPRAYTSVCVVFFAVVIFFCGLRSGIADTGTYIQIFEEYPNSLNGINFDDINKGIGFYILSVAYKSFISTDFHGYLFLITLISGIAVAKAFLKYSSSFGFTCFLFISSTIFTYLVNGIRQFICVSILFCCMNYIVEKKFWKFLFWVVILSAIHSSALIMIPAYFVVQMKPLTNNSIFLLTIVAGVGVLYNRLAPMMDTLLKNTEYAGYSDMLLNGSGSSIIRLGIALVPVAFAFLGRNVIHAMDNKIVNVCVNMSMINFALYCVATFTSGLAVGRITTYFDMYNLLLLPWLIDHLFEQRSKKIIAVTCVLAYIVFFYFQMKMTWGMVYESDILNLYC